MTQEILAAVVTGAAGIIAAAITGFTSYIAGKRRGIHTTEKTPPVRVREYLEDPLMVLSSRKNQKRIESDFLTFERATLLMWVRVPPVGQALRDSPSHRYLVAHNTGEKEPKEGYYRNQFSLRHSSRRGRWELTLSNDNAEYHEGLFIGDGLEEGWHHFMISWDHKKPLIRLHIDADAGGSSVSTSYLPNFPTKLAGNVSIGSWTSDWAGHYAETMIARVWVVNSALSVADEIVKEHFAYRPGM